MLPPSPIRFARPGLVRGEVYEHLKRGILEGRIKNGQRLAEETIATELGVSRTPVREAVQRLAQDGFVEVIPNKGARVRSPSREEILQAYTVRESLEGLAASLAAVHHKAHDLERMQNALNDLEALPAGEYFAQIAADLEFHAAIATASKNMVLIGILQSLRDTLARARFFTRKTNQTTKTAQEHQAIFEHIRNHNAELAEDAARSHVQRFQRVLLTELEQGDE